MGQDRVHSLLESIKLGNQESLAELYDLTYLDIYKYIYSITSNKEYAQDLTHDTYIHVFKNIHSYSGKGHAMAWLITVSRNLTYMFLRRNNKTILVDYEIDSAVNVVESMNNSLLMDMIMRELDEEEREIVVLHIIENLTFIEISKIIGKGLSTVLSKYHRCIKRLKKKYGGVGNE